MDDGDLKQFLSSLRLFPDKYPKTIVFEYSGHKYCRDPSLYKIIESIELV